MDLMKWIAWLLVFQCFVYKDVNSPLAWELGIAITPDRLVFMIVLTLAVSRLLSGTLRVPRLGKVAGYILLFALVCTLSSMVSGNALERATKGYDHLTRLFDFIYIPFLVFLIVSCIPHSPKKIELLSFALLVLGAYLAINGVFEYLRLNALVWPKYILDPNVGTQFGRIRGSFAGSEALGGALIVTFLFHVLRSTRVQGGTRVWLSLMTLVTAGVIYTTNQRSIWLCFALCVIVLAVVKNRMRRIAVVMICATCLAFFGGVASKFSVTEGTLFSKRQETVDYRLVNYLTLLEMSKANPIFGVGWGNFKTEWPKYVQFIPGIDIGPGLTDGNHNLFLGLLAEVGLVGLLLYLLIFYYMFRSGLRVFRRATGLEREFALIFLLVLSSYLFRGNFGDHRYYRFDNTVLFLFFGMIAGIETHMAFTTARSGTAVARHAVQQPYPIVAEQ